jgi:hypothetical protein
MIAPYLFEERGCSHGLTRNSARAERSNLGWPNAKVRKDRFAVSICLGNVATNRQSLIVHLKGQCRKPHSTIVWDGHIYKSAGLVEMRVIEQLIRAHDRSKRKTDRFKAIDELVSRETFK